MRQSNPLLALLSCALLAACGGEADNSFCAIHAADHWQHRDQHASLELVYRADGALSASLRLPRALAGAAGQPDRLDEVLDLPSHCALGETVLSPGEGMIMAHYQADCGPEQLPEAISIPLFQRFGELAELEVTMTTPAVSKHFIVHRDCDRALFNITGAPVGG